MVSVIIPNYNHFNYLKQRIDSVLNQTYSDIEVIILDDCSPDNSRDIIETYRLHPKVSTVVYNETNSGSVFKQWKKGIRLAKGEFVWIAESDDFANEDLLAEMISVLKSDKEIGLVYCNSKIVYESEQSVHKFETLNDLRKYMYNTTIWDSSFTMDGFEFLKKYLSKKCVINNASAVVFRKSVLEQLSIDLEEYKYAGDWAVYCDIAKKNKISFINKELSYYRDHSNNASKKAFNNFQINFENYKILSDNYNYLSKRGANTFVFLYKIRRSFLHLLIPKKNRKYIYDNYKRINKKMIRKSLIFLPQVFFETKLCDFYHNRNK